MTINHQTAVALLALADRLDASGAVWALTGSLGHALQGVPVEPRDIDVQTDESGAYTIAAALQDHVVRPVAYSFSENIRSHYGEFLVAGIKVEVMGAVEQRAESGKWKPPVDVQAHRIFVHFQGHSIPLLNLVHETEAYELLGRHDRAELLRRHSRLPVNS